MPERARRAGDAVLVAGRIERMFTVCVTFGGVLSVLGGDEADFDDAREARGHEGVSEDGVDPQPRYQARLRSSRKRGGRTLVESMRAWA